MLIPIQHTPLQEDSGAAPERSSNIDWMFQEGSYVRSWGTFQGTLRTFSGNGHGAFRTFSGNGHGAFRTFSGNGHGTVRRFYSDVVSAKFVWHWRKDRKCKGNWLNYNKYWQYSHIARECPERSVTIARECPERSMKLAGRFHVQCSTATLLECSRKVPMSAPGEHSTATPMEPFCKLRATECAVWVVGSNVTNQISDILIYSSFHM